MPERRSEIAVESPLVIWSMPSPSNLRFVLLPRAADWPKQANANFGKSTPEWTLGRLAQHCEAEPSHEGEVRLGDYCRFARRQLSSALSCLDHWRYPFSKAISHGKDPLSERWKPVAQAQDVLRQPQVMSLT